MEEVFLYQQVAESIRRQILSGELKPGDNLPSVRQMTAHWDCTLGTIQRAYQDLARQGLIVSRPGKGTHIAKNISLSSDTPIRRANIIHKAESFLIEVITAGYSPDEIEQSVRMALDRWRAVEQQKPRQPPENIIRFAGSHDLAISWIAAHFDEFYPNFSFQVIYNGSLSGLIALAEGQADLAGSHLWDVDSNTYNIPFIRRILPSTRCAIITLAHRRLGLILAPRNPLNIQDLSDLIRPEIRMINRQPGSGTRVWFDIRMRQLGFISSQINGYNNVKFTHSDVARAIAEGQADVGIGLEAAALAFGLEFVFLTRERYDLVVPYSNFSLPPIETLLEIIKQSDFKNMITNLGGYDTNYTGAIEWVE